MTVELSVVSFISALLVLVPLPWHWKTRNVCTTSSMLWLSASNIIRAINIIAWLDNDTIKYKIWCDIVTRAQLAANIGVPAATMAPTQSEKRQRVKFEIGMCIVLPIILTSLHVIVESCRFGITKGFGCSICYYPSIPALFIQHIPAVLLSWAALIYSGVTLRWLIHRRVQFQQAQVKPLARASSLYIRLIALTITQMTFASVMSLFLITIEMHSGIYPWTSWEEVHENWSEVFVQPRESVPELYWAAAMVSCYFVPIASVTTFGYFGFDERVIAEYRSMISRMKVHISSLRAKKTMVLPLSVKDAVPGSLKLGANIAAIDMGRRNGTQASGSDSLSSADTQSWGI